MSDLLLPNSTSEPGAHDKQIDAVLRPLLIQLCNDGLTLQQAALRIGHVIGLDLIREHNTH